VTTKLHLGCGKRYIPGFIHIDLANYAHIDYNHDVNTLPMFDGGSVDLIYACHVLEYFDRVEVVDVLREWYRVLRRGGALRVAVPDFDALWQQYEFSQELDDIIGPLYGRWEVPGTNQIVYHKTIYDCGSLRATLLDAGFSNIHRYNWRDTIHKDYDDYSQAYIPHMDKENGLLISLNMEAVKL